MNDSTAPILLGLDLPASISFSATYAQLFASVRAQDPGGAGVKRVTLFFDRELAFGAGAVRSRSIAIGEQPGDSFADATPGSASASFTLSPYTAPGTYNIVKAWVEDLDGNRATYTGAQLQALGVTTALRVSGSIDDTAAPTLLALDLPDSVDVGAPRAELRMTAQLKDNPEGSGVLVTQVYFDRPLRTHNTATPDLVLYPDAIRPGATPVGATGTLALAPDTAPGTYTIAKLVTVDWSGNRSSYSGAELAAMGVDTRFTVTGSVPAAPMASMAVDGGSGSVILSFVTPAWHMDASGAFRLEIFYDPTQARFSSAVFTGRGGMDVVASASEVGSSGVLTLTRSAMPVLDPGAKLLVILDPVAEAGKFSYFVPAFTVAGVAQKLPHPGLALYRGSAGDDVVASGVVYDRIEGNGGIDTASFTGNRDSFVVRRFEGGFAVDHPDGHETRLNWVEHLAFSDRSVALDIEGVAGQAYRLYQAALGRTPDLAGLGYWIDRMEKGASLRSVADAFIQDREFIRLNGDGSDAGAFATQLYQNVLQRAPDPAGLAFWVAALEGGLARADMLVGFSESAENVAQVTGQIAHGIDYLPW